MTTSTTSAGRYTKWQVGASEDRLETDDDVPLRRLRDRVRSDSKRWARTGLVFEGVESDFLPGSLDEFVITGQGYRLFGRRRDGYWPVDALLKAAVDDWNELAN